MKVILGKLLKSRTPEEGRSSMREIYLGILFGMLAFMITRFFVERRNVEAGMSKVLIKSAWGSDEPIHV